MSMKATLIHNPAAGDDRQPTAGQLQALMKEAGYKVRYQSSKEKGWRKALKKKTDIVVVAAGDGTVGNVARRMIDSGIPIAVLPMGTANNISRTLGIAEWPATQLIRGWKSSRRLKFDAGIATGPWGERYFIEGVGAGLLTSAIPEVQDNKTMVQLRETQARVTYAQQILREHIEDSPAIDLQIALDGKDLSGRYVMVEVLNMKYVGPNLFLAPDVVRNDGQFQVVLLAHKDRRKLHTHIKNWQEGKPWPAEFGTLQGRRLQIEWNGFPLHIDDKIWPKEDDTKGKGARGPATVYVKVKPKAVEFLVPAEIADQQKRLQQNGTKKPRARPEKRR